MTKISLKINKKLKTKKSKTYFIADIGANHDGSLIRAKKLIKICKNIGVDAVKFQHFNAKTIVSDNGFKNVNLKSHQSKWKKSTFEVYQDASINQKWTKILRNYCDKVGIDFMTSPYSYELADQVEKYVHAIKIGSGDINWTNFLEYLSRKKTPLILATGSSTLKEVKDAVKILLKRKKTIVLMQCNTNYTGNKDNFKYVNLNVLDLYKKIFPNVLLGLSDHTTGHTTVLGAVTKGATFIEKHLTDDNNRNGPDHKFALNPIDFKNMILRTRELELALGDGVKRVEKNELNTNIIQKRSAYAKYNLKKGQILHKEDIIFLRPALKGSLLPNQLGKKKFKLKKNIKESFPIKCKHLEI